MSYDIYIGEPHIEYYPEDGYMKISVEHISLETAPDFGFGDISGKSNGRHPGYSQMHDFCRTSGLYELFFDEYNGFLRPHPGCKPITQEHLQVIMEARVKWEKEHPNCKENLPSPDKEPKGLDWSGLDEYSKKYDWTYARLVWYEFWFDWALKNCKMPSIAND